jgi:hypothetical protein
MFCSPSAKLLGLKLQSLIRFSLCLCLFLQSILKQLEVNFYFIFPCDVGMRAGCRAFCEEGIKRISDTSESGFMAAGH